MASGAVRVHGLRELNRAFARADKETRKEVRAAERAIAEPVRATAENLAGSEISGLQRSPQWAGMRIGVTRSLIYVAPKSRRKIGSRRPNLAGLLLSRAMEPALEQHRGDIERAIERALDRIADHFGKG